MNKCSRYHWIPSKVLITASAILGASGLYRSSHKESLRGTLRDSQRVASLESPPTSLVHIPHVFGEVSSTMPGENISSRDLGVPF
ncbi:hypothetical protein TNCV_864291 [Trichonephila clavipes]|nr:hypothetical protein TNCV_864291 [Trichonephila clavipes]